MMRRLSKLAVSGLAMVTLLKLMTECCSVLDRLKQQNVNALRYHWRKRLRSFIPCAKFSARLLGFCETVSCQPMTRLDTCSLVKFLPFPCRGSQAYEKRNECSLQGEVKEGRGRRPRKKRGLFLASMTTLTTAPWFF